MLRRTPVLAVLLSLAITFVSMSPTQAVAPDVTAITVSNPTIYPGINAGKWPGSTTITIESTDLTTDHLEVRNATDDVVNTLPVSSGTTATWNARDTGGALVPAGTYTIIALNSAMEAATTTGTVTVSRQHLIRKTFTKLVLPTSKFFTIVGKCSKLRKPARKGWKGSLGYAANTKCKTQTWKASSVITGHFVRLPVAARYVDLRIDTYGGAAKAQPGSRGGIEYYSNTASGWTAFKWATKKTGWHNGVLRSAPSLVDDERYTVWRFFTAYKAQYDVKQFRVVAHYDVLSAS